MSLKINYETFLCNILYNHDLKVHSSLFVSENNNSI